MASMSVSKTEDPGSSPGAPAIFYNNYYTPGGKSEK